MKRLLFSVLLSALLAMPNSAHAHFLWLVVRAHGGSSRVEIYFSESAEPGEPELLKRIKSPEIVGLSGKKSWTLQPTFTDESLHAVTKGGKNAIYTMNHNYGVISRGGDSFLLKYYAKTGPTAESAAWSNTNAGKHIKLDVVPERTNDGIKLTATFDGKPAAKAQVVIEAENFSATELEADERGQVTFAPEGSGLYSIRVRHIEETQGEFEGEEYAAVRHYLALALPVSDATKASQLPDVPAAVTSFGGAIIDDNLYIYGGHTGDAHSYHGEAQAKKLLRLNLTGKPKWKEVAKGPGLQGLAMVAHGGKLYRLGGFTAKNKEGEEQDLWSQDDVACYDPKSGEWSELPALPEPRSSFDAAVLDDTIYVVGGWKLQGGDDSQWHRTAYSLDLSQSKPAWKALPEPPFVRRALAAAVHKGKLYAIGGMQQKGSPTTAVAIYDPQTKTWSEGPAIPGKDMEGFGASAFAVGGKLYVSTISGALLALSDDEASWEKVAQLDRERFFHRMLPVGDNQLLMVGGASMSVGKFTKVDLITVD